MGTDMMAEIIVHPRLATGVQRLLGQRLDQLREQRLRALEHLERTLVSLSSMLRDPQYATLRPLVALCIQEYEAFRTEIEALDVHVVRSAKDLERTVHRAKLLSEYLTSLTSDLLASVRDTNRATSRGAFEPGTPRPAHTGS